MISRFVRVALACCLTMGAAVTVQASPFAYVASNDGQDLTVIDTALDAAVDTIPMSGAARGAALDPSGTRVYVTRQINDGVVVVDALTNTILTTIPIGPFPIGFPEDIVYNAPLQRLYVSTGVDRVLVIDAVTNTVLTPITLTVDASDLRGIAVTPDGTKAYATRFNNGDVFVIDTATDTLATTIPAAGNGDVLVDATGTTAYATNAFASEISVIDVATDAVTDSIPVGALCGPSRLALHPDGSTLYVSCTSSDEVGVIDLGTATLTTSIPVGDAPIGIAITPDGAKVYATSIFDDAVSVIDTGSNLVVDSIPVGALPVSRGEFIGPAFVCGNGTHEPGEHCDDGNAVDDDECSNTCQTYHDTVVVAGKPLKLVLSGASVQKRVAVKVVNADPATETAGHPITLDVASTCPPGAVSQADFDKATPGAQSTVVLAGGKKAVAILTVTADPSAFATFNAKTPTRCTVTVTAQPEIGTADPNPSNDAMTFDVDVFDKNDPPQSAIHESFVRSAKPLLVKLGFGKPEIVKTAKVQPGSGDLFPGVEDPVLHPVTVSIVDDCPAGVVGALDLDASTPGPQNGASIEGGKLANGKLPITVTGASVDSPSKLSPVRCQATVTVTGPAGDTDSSNDQTKLVIDIIDQNDF